MFEDVQTSRAIVVFGDGEIREIEENSGSNFKRQRTIFVSGEWQLSYKDKDSLDYGYAVLYFVNGDVWRGELYKNKWHGLLEQTYTNGRKDIGSCLNNKKFGDWRVIEKDGTVNIYQC